MAKNVAADVAKNICDSVTNKLEGKICGKKFQYNYQLVIMEFFHITDQIAHN